MVRIVLYEKDFAQRFAAVSEFHCGILLSGLINDEEHLLLPIELPPKQERTNPQLEANREYEKIKDIDEKWVTAHCKNLIRMIPGGVRLSGIFLVASSSDFNSSMEHVKKILTSLPKHESVVTETVEFDSPERILLLVDPNSKKFSCQVFDTTSVNAQFHSVPIKQRQFLDYFRAFKTYINLSLETVLPADRKKEEILLKLQTAVKPYMESLLTDAKLLIDGEFRDDSDQVFSTLSDSASSSVITKKTGKKKGGGHRRSKSGLLDLSDVQLSSGDYHDLETAGTSAAEKTFFWAPVELVIFGPQFPRWQRASSCSSLESGTGTDGTDSSGNGFVPVNRLVVSGHIPGIAFLPSNTTVQKLFQALRKDLIQGILARLELLTDELHITSGELEIPRMRLPQRVLVRLPACPVLPLSDYKFVSETADDVVARLHYFCLPLGTQAAAQSAHVSDQSAGTTVASRDADSGPMSSRDQIDASCLDTSLEKCPDDSNDDYPDAELMDEVNQTVQPVAQFISFSNPVFRLLTVAVLLGAVLISWFLYSARLPTIS